MAETSINSSNFHGSAGGNLPQQLQPQIPDAMTGLREALQGLDQDVATLIERLRPVVVFVPEEAKVGTPLSQRVDLAAAIDQNTAHARYLNAKVKDLLSGLQL
jgi:hypothetical protein